MNEGKVNGSNWYKKKKDDAQQGKWRKAGKENES